MLSTELKEQNKNLPSPDGSQKDLATKDLSELHHKRVPESSAEKNFKRILVIDDDPDMTALLRTSLIEKYNCSVDVAGDPFDAMNMMADGFYNLIVLDWKLQGLNGGQTLKHAERDLFFEPALAIQWDREVVPVVIFSSAKKATCDFISTKHFRYTGFVSKCQSLNEIIESFSQYLGPKHHPRLGVA